MTIERGTKKIVDKVEAAIEKKVGALLREELEKQLVVPTSIEKEIETACGVLHPEQKEGL